MPATEVLQGFCLVGSFVKLDELKREVSRRIEYFCLLSEGEDNCNGLSSSLSRLELSKHACERERQREALFVHFSQWVVSFITAPNS